MTTPPFVGCRPLPTPGMSAQGGNGRQYEIGCDGGGGWRWRLVERHGHVLAAAPRSLSRERCLKAVRILQMTTQAPVLVRAGTFPLTANPCASGESSL